MHVNAFGPDRAEHRITESTVRIMIFDGKEPPLRGAGAVQQRCTVDGEILSRSTIRTETPAARGGSQRTFRTL